MLVKTGKCGSANGIWDRRVPKQGIKDDVEGQGAEVVCYLFGDVCKAAQMRERQLIERIRVGSTTRNRGVRVGIGDDCAVLRVPAGHEMVVTTDFSLEGRHFRKDWHTAESAGHRCLARGLSDVAAMGAKPIAAFLSLALPREFEVGWVDGFMAGFNGLAERFGVELAGGDTAEAPGAETLADVMVVGAIEPGRALRRSGAKVGDSIFCTGRLGGAAAELAGLASGKAWKGDGHPQLFPEPRVKVGRELLKRRLATSCMDLSDGLSTDLWHLCEASGVGAEIEEEALPVWAGATPDQALNGGEDYELLFTVGVGIKVPGSIAGVEVTRLGTVLEAGAGVGMMKRDGSWKQMEAGGWEHFGGGRVEKAVGPLAR